MRRIVSVVLGAGFGVAAFGGTALATMGHGVWTTPGAARAGEMVTVTTHCEGRATIADITGDAFAHGAKGVRVDANGHASATLMVRPDIEGGAYELRAECVLRDGTADKTGTVTIVPTAPEGGAAAGFGPADRSDLVPLGVSAVAAGTVLGVLAVRRSPRPGS